MITVNNLEDILKYYMFENISDVRTVYPLSILTEQIVLNSMTWLVAFIIFISIILKVQIIIFSNYI